MPSRPNAVLIAAGASGGDTLRIFDGVCIRGIVPARQVHKVQQAILMHLPGVIEASPWAWRPGLGIPRTETSRRRVAGPYGRSRERARPRRYSLR